jgi:dCTP deaminase
MIKPFVERQVRQLETGGRVISYGLSGYGYDLRVADEFKVFTNVYNTVLDPKAFDPKSFVDVRNDVCIVPPNPFAPHQHFSLPCRALTLVPTFAVETALGERR